MLAETPILEMKGITKQFPGVTALEDVSIEVYKGECLGLVGENGAGKTTLVELLNPHPAPTGYFRQDKGTIVLDGKEITIKDPKDSLRLGISVIHQHPSLIPYLSVAENIFLGIEPKSSVLNIIDDKSIENKCKEVLSKLGLNIDVNQPVYKLTYAQSKMVELARAILFNTRLLIVDEITAALDEEDTRRIFNILNDLKRKKIGIIYIGHRLDEVLEICDRVVVLRDGRKVAEAKTENLTKDELIRWMVGRPLIVHEKKRKMNDKQELLRVESLSGAGFVNDVSFTLYKGEILGIAGLVGSGRSEVAEMIFGSIPLEKGKIFLEGKPITIGHPADALKFGIGLVPEHRQKQGLVLSMSVRENLTLTILRTIIGLLGFIKKTEIDIVSDYIKKLQIITSSPDRIVNSLSGGNQQKVVLGKWLATRLKVLIVDEPTKGVDVGAKAEIYKILNELAENGMGILMISSELPEIINVSDRIIVMCEGRITKIFDHPNVTQEMIMHYATYQRRTA